MGIADHKDTFHFFIAFEEMLDFLQGDSRSPVERKTICAAADGGKSNGAQVVFFQQAKTIAITLGQQLFFVVLAACPDRSDGMNDILCRETIATRDLGLSGGAAAQSTAFLK